MRSLGEGVRSATMRKRESFQPRNYPCRTGSRGSFPGSQHWNARYGERTSGVPGSKSVADGRTVCIGTWEGRGAPYRSPREAEKAGRGYGAAAVGLTRSRGVGRVIPVEGRCPLEGVSVLTQREEY
jgi:hypothetical protein